jgi:hypothetical protein
MPRAFSMRRVARNHHGGSSLIPVKLTELSENLPPVCIAGENKKAAPHAEGECALIALSKASSDVLGNLA